MRRYVYILMLFFLSLNSSAQIRHTFFDGATFGVSNLNTTYSMMYYYFEKEPTNYGECLYLTKIRYANYSWDQIYANFYNGKFCKVSFIYDGLQLSNVKSFATHNELVNRYNNLSRELREKYSGKHKLQKIQQKFVEGFYFYDGRYCVELILKSQAPNGKKKYTKVEMTYSDVQWMKQPEKPRIRINGDL